MLSVMTVQRLNKYDLFIRVSRLKCLVSGKENRKRNKTNSNIVMMQQTTEHGGVGVMV